MNKLECKISPNKNHKHHCAKMENKFPVYIQNRYIQENRVVFLSVFVKPQIQHAQSNRFQTLKFSF